MKFITSKRFRQIAVSVLLGLIILFFALAFATSGDSGISVWNYYMSSIENPGDVIFLGALSIIFYVTLVIVVLSLIFLWVKGKSFYLVAFSAALISQIVNFVANGVVLVFEGRSVGLSVLVLILSILGIGYHILCKIFNPDDFKRNTEVNTEGGSHEFLVSEGCAVITSIVASLSSIAIIIATLFIPFYTLTVLNGGGSYYYIPNSILSGDKTTVNYILYMVIVCALISAIVYFANNMGNLKDKQLFVIKSKFIVYGTFVFTIIYMLLGMSLSFFSKVEDTVATSQSYIPMILSTVVTIVFSLLAGNHGDKRLQLKKFPNFILLIYTIAFVGMTIVSLFLQMIKVTSGSTVYFELTAIDMLKEHAFLSDKFALTAFIIQLFIIADGAILICCLASFFAKNKLFYKLAPVSILFSEMFLFVIGMFGKYYEAIQQINESMINDLLGSFSVLLPSDIEYTVTSQTLYVFLASVALLVVVIVHNPLKKVALEEAVDANVSIKEAPKMERGGVQGAESLNNPSLTEYDFDPCPAFTELDEKRLEFDSLLEEKRVRSFASPSLPSLVRFIVEFARDSDKHLSYTPEDIATFISGLGATRLTILQGMSGTGKTSLPKIFAEAIDGKAEIIEVESSWRDKNELLGYYNEFSKTYTPKKFTQALYRAKLNPEIITFIVLDEMNLSRIEYYFSDFLSLMEARENEREIKLLNVKLEKVDGDDRYGYSGLDEGHTIKIPTNVWFIGTANRDESTFEISDKVYDRAHTMNFNKRAKKVETMNLPLLPAFLNYESFSSLLYEAKNRNRFNASGNPIIEKVESLLAPYNISFGNRILNQIEDFVTIYKNCFDGSAAREREGLEKILLSKVVAKLESKSVESKEALKLGFEKLQMYACVEFIDKLNID